MQPHKYGPYLLYFLSIDIINSTKLKYESKKKKQNSSSWSLKFKAFFEDVEKKLTNEYLNVFNHKGPISFPFKWRIIGDEIIYFCEIRNLEELPKHVEIALSFIKNFQDPKQTFQIKISSWIAGFPVNNALYLAHDDKKLKSHNEKFL